MVAAETDQAASFAYVENQVVLASVLQKKYPVQCESLLADAVIVEDTFEGLETLRSLPSLTTHYEELGVEIEGISYESPGNDSYRILGDFNQQNKTNMQSSPYSFSSCFKRENILVHLNEMTNVEKNDYSIPRRRAFSLR